MWEYIAGAEQFIRNYREHCKKNPSFRAAVLEIVQTFLLHILRVTDWQVTGEEISPLPPPSLADFSRSRHGEFLYSKRR
jgi:hypothetical protein